MPGYKQIKSDLKNAANPVKAVDLARFFKTGKGEYGEGDIFWGITVPVQREIAKKHFNATNDDIKKLLCEPVHECRLTALLILVQQYSKGDPVKRKMIADFYLSNTKMINNWDLVDLTADKILGHYLMDKDRAVLYKLAESSSIWEQRIAVISTHHFIKNMDFKDTLSLCEKLMNHKHDLIHKATGWMLREAGKKDLTVLTGFLDRYCKVMPRTMLRYAIEKLDDNQKKKYMAK
ncbi:MAG TPA: DNA alkylation repair protein [Spirochaetota bacterium]|nr:DNA alkylation repair protein [Spirochaetota bacterium]HPF06105.1 DNA alkylation repair protein [Spirochaetota bacterium]HPJ42699.1 DNA alkylation repair protein [Spirochaetota bacterium]HPR36928.1 DNA alkylation repair protein [Spirochaetota bacterium]HRX47359.1 DNA alkylation repair protein [Spirochaetota bacterium]